MSREPEVIDICCTVLAETDKAWKLNDGTRDAWLPKSQVENSDEVKVRETGVFVMPVWLARDKGFV